MKLKSTDSIALKHQSEHYPERFAGKVPKVVKMTKTVTSEFGMVRPVIRACRNQTYDVRVNSHGAVTAIAPEGFLGLKPDEFEVVEYHYYAPNSKNPSPKA